MSQTFCYVLNCATGVTHELTLIRVPLNGVLILLMCDPAGLTWSWQQAISMTYKSWADSSKPSRLPETRELSFLPKPT